MRENRAIGLAHDHRSLNIADRQGLSAKFLSLSQRRDRVGRFARLRDDQQQRVFIHHRVAVTKLRGIVDIHLNASKLLNHVLTRQAGMPGRAARSDLDGSESFKVGFGNVLHRVEKNTASVQRDAALHGVAHGTRLLINLFEHEMFEATFFRHDRIPGDALDSRLNRIGFEVGYAHRVSIDNGHLAVAEKKDVSRVLQNWRNIGGYKKLAIAETNYNWRSLPYRYDHVRLVSVNNRQRKDAFEVQHRATHGLFKIVMFFQILFD